jgi:hypothetical protein
MGHVKQCPEALVKHTKKENKIEILFRNMCIQHFVNVKVTFPILNLIFSVKKKSFFYFLFWYA